MIFAEVEESSVPEMFAEVADDSDGEQIEKPHEDERDHREK
jgi:hypothetical protein